MLFNFRLFSKVLYSFLVLLLIIFVGTVGYVFFEGWGPLDSFYQTIITVSTVGFGEMLPIGPIGKSIMIFEGILGGLILAILIIALYKKSMDR